MGIARQSNFQRDLSRLSISFSGECLWLSAILSFFSYCWFACGSPCKTAQTLPRILSRISQGILPLAVRWASNSPLEDLSAQFFILMCHDSCANRIPRYVNRRSRHIQ